jgi:rubredoxin
MRKFRCKSCLYIHRGEDAPKFCPKCGAPSEQFELIPENLSTLIDRSGYTNELLMKTYNIINDLHDASIKGINDNLDSSCLYIFRQISEFSQIIKAMILAEINTHIEKGKWG